MQTSKLGTFNVLSSAGLNVSKINTYLVLQQVDMRASKINTYRVMVSVVPPLSLPLLLRYRLRWDEFNDQDDAPRRSPFQRLSPAPFPPPSPQLPAGPPAMLRYRQSWDDEDEPSRARPVIIVAAVTGGVTLPSLPRMLRVRMGWEDEDDALRPPRMGRFTPPRIVSTMVDYAVCVIT